MRGALGHLAILLVLASGLARCGELSLNLPPLSSPGDGGDVTASSSVVPCTVQSQCADAGGSSLCDVEAGACVQCLSNDDCSGSTPHCIGGACVSCTTTADCPTNKVCNTHIPRCETQCTTGDDCIDAGGGPCATAYGYCVECLVNADCTTKSLPRCNPPPYGLCVECLSSADCDGGTCGPAQHCE